MANRITTIFDFSERGGGLKKIKADVDATEGSINKAKVGVKGLWAEFTNNRAAQAAVGAVATKIAVDAVNAASDLEESVNAVNTTFNEHADSIGRLSDKSVENYGLSERAFNDMSVAFSGFATQVAGEGGNVSEVIDDMATRVADFASVHNLTTDEAMTKFQSALAGETEAMRRYGIDVSAATVKTHAYEKGIAAAGSELTEAQKVQARYSLLMQETDQWAGDFANTSEGLANQQRILNAELENLQATLGRQLLPIVTENINRLTDMASTVSDLTTKFEDLGQSAPGWLKEINKLWGPQLIMDISTAPIDAVGWAFNKLGGDAEDANEQVYESSRKAGKQVDEYVASTIEAEDITSDYTKAQELVADAIKYATYEQEHSNAALDKARAFAERAAEYVRNLGSQWDRLKDKLNDRSAFLDVEDSFDSVQAAAERAWTTAKEGSEDAEQAARDYERAQIDLKNKVIDYGNEVAELPDQVLTNILSLIDQGKLAEAEAALERLERARTINYIPVVQAPRAPGGSRFMDSGGAGRAGDIVAERRAEFVGGALVSGPGMLGGPASVTGGATTEQLLREFLEKVGGGGGGPTIIIQGGYVDDRTIGELERRLDQWRRGMR